ncbi:hypothetical protein MAR_028719 [Mya arenaria]|uniref:THAP-type domain-containing protein n=1 Tax=Mya arenaria TaxID=6604 RepID=A0ABY7DED6_MYAAR|nr:uncharacterized protein LOC128246512 [Mya arenaria]WAQ96029.1 hypothetical protein MAR_028719 [Mya arenaria]
MVKRCAWGLCKSDSRYPERLGEGVEFLPFPKPKRNLNKCLRWIMACGRPQDQLNPEYVNGNYHLYVCTKHFPEGKPTEKFPDPLPAIATGFVKIAPKRPPPKQRNATPPVPKAKRKVLRDQDPGNESNVNTSQCPASDDSTKPAGSGPMMLPVNPPNPQSVETTSKSNNEEKPKDNTPSLEFQALTEINKRLQQQLAKQILMNDDLRRENATLKGEIKSMQKCVQRDRPPRKRPSRAGSSSQIQTLSQNGNLSQNECSSQIGNLSEIGKLNTLSSIGNSSQLRNFVQIKHESQIENLSQTKNSTEIEIVRGNSHSFLHPLCEENPCQPNLEISNGYVKDWENNIIVVKQEKE